MKILVIRKIEDFLKTIDSTIVSGSSAHRLRFFDNCCIDFSISSKFLN